MFVGIKMRRNNGNIEERKKGKIGCSSRSYKMQNMYIRKEKVINKVQTQSIRIERPLKSMTLDFSFYRYGQYAQRG